MSAILLAVFNDYGAAEHARCDLVRDGFPTDRVELTASCEPGRAEVEPADSPHGKFVQYYSALFGPAHRLHNCEQIAARVENGAATITVHPRGMLETVRATEILGRSGPADVVHHDLAHQALEHASSRGVSPWVRALWIDTPSDTGCIYCRLFERSTS